MPFYKGSYGTLGHWGKKPRQGFTKKRILLVTILLSLSLIFAISNNSTFPIRTVQGDYNSSYSHTRTPIFVDTNLDGPTAGVGLLTFKSVQNGTSSGSASLILTLTGVSTNDAIIVAIFEPQPVTAFTVTDGQGNTYTQRAASPSVVGQTQFQTAIASASGSDAITIATTSAPTWDASALDYSGQGGFGSSASSEYTAGTAQSGTDTLSLTTSSSSFILEIFDASSASASACSTISTTPNNGQNVREAYCPAGVYSKVSDVTGFSGTNSIGYAFTYGAAVNCPVSANCFHHHSGLELKQGTPITTDSSLVRWNFNSTCVTLNRNGDNPAFAKFDFSKGSSGSKGSNCSSADIIISKSPANFQTASGRMLEMVLEWINNAAGTSQNVTLVARTNGTLPSFTENYNPFSDTQARMIWQTTTAGSANVPSTAGTDSLYVARDQSHTITQDGLSNDLVIQGATGLNGTLSTLSFAQQVVLNFTGSKNFLLTYGPVIVSSSTSNATASSFQFGQDYYLIAMAGFKGTPCVGCNMEFVSPNAAPPPVTVKPFGIWSVPSACNDPVNSAACGLGTPQPTFNFNPLDPSSWGNAILKGMLWVFTVGVPLAFGVAVAVIVTEIRIVFNFVGNNFGWGNTGDNIISFFGGVASLFSQFGTAFGWLASLISNAISAIGVANLFSTPYFTGLANVLNDFKNAIGSSLIISMINQIAFWFPTSYMIILIMFYFLLVFMSGLKGFFEWIHLVKWSSFQFFDLFARILDGFIALITAILGRISVISPGHKFPKIPKLNAGPLPKIDLSRDVAFFDDPTAWFLAFTGTIFTMMWAGTSAAGLPANTQTIIQSFSTLFLTLFGVGFMLLILYIPGFLLAKLYEKGILK